MPTRHSVASCIFHNDLTGQTPNMVTRVLTVLNFSEFSINCQSASEFHTEQNQPHTNHDLVRQLVSAPSDNATAQILTLCFVASYILARLENHYSGHLVAKDYTVKERSVGHWFHYRACCTRVNNSLFVTSQTNLH